MRLFNGKHWINPREDATYILTSEADVEEWNTIPYSAWSRPSIQGHRHTWQVRRNSRPLVAPEYLNRVGHTVYFEDLHDGYTMPRGMP